MPTLDYTPIDYNSWNFGGQGKNILDSLKKSERDIWGAALPFQDKREDIGHAETVTYFALKILESIPADRRIVIPAAILHDTGWSQLSSEEIAKFYLPNWKEFEPQLRRKHQEEGVKTAREVLGVLYKKELIPSILEIISQHDTRQGFLNTEDGVVRDADKLWIFTAPCCELAVRKERNFGKSIYNQLNEWLSSESFFYSPISKSIARKEFENSLSYLHEKNISLE